MLQRNYGLDLLRMTAMFMVLLLHTMGQGGILEHLNTPPYSTFVYFTKYSVAWYIEIFAYCAVNCYALLTGYNYFGKEVKYIKLVEFWLQIVFYTVGINLIFYVMGTHIGKQLILTSIFPIMRRFYWYTTAYFGMFLFIPIMNQYLENISQQALKKFLVIAFCLFSILPTIMRENPFYLQGGYSMLWLVMLFLVGGAIKKLKLFDSFSSKKLLGAFFVSTLLTLAFKLLVELVMKIWSKKLVFANVFIDYTSPTIVLAAIFLLVLFSKLDIKNNILLKVIQICSPAAFGIYLIHLHPLIWNKYIHGFSVRFLNSNPLIMVGKIFASALAIYVVCTFIELLRMKLFECLKVKQLVKAIERRLAG